tara:strand:- start:390 stop:647 length:258 start_codon:yes stop_codon:yes gene_type:complete
MPKDKLPDNVIPFPNMRERVGKKYRQQEIAHLVDMLKLCDEDMTTILQQIDQLQLELASLTADYEKFMDKLEALLQIEEGEDSDR